MYIFNKAARAVVPNRRTRWQQPLCVAIIRLEVRKSSASVITQRKRPWRSVSRIKKFIITRTKTEEARISHGARSPEEIYFAGRVPGPAMISSRWNVEKGRRSGAERKIGGRCRGPSGDARRPGSEDVRVIGPLLRFRLLRSRRPRFGAPLLLPLPLVTQSSRYTAKRCLPGVGGELLITDLPAAPLAHLAAPPSLLASLAAIPKSRHHLVLRYTCYLPRIIRPTVLPPLLSSRPVFPSVLFSSCSFFPRGLAPCDRTDSFSSRNPTDRRGGRERGSRGNGVIVCGERWWFSRRQWEGGWRRYLLWLVISI